jgi:hypothetical protein
LDHLSAEDDALGVAFHQSKSKQDGKEHECALGGERGRGRKYQFLLEQTIQRLISKLTIVPANVQVPFPIQPIDCNLYVWDNRLHKLPKDFYFPSCEFAIGWQLWWKGNAVEKYLPYRSIATIDLSTKQKQKTFSDWKCLMSYASRMLEESGATVTVDNATALTNEAFHFLPQDHVTPRNRERKSC